MQRKTKTRIFRIIRKIGRFFCRRKIWLVSDRAYNADDNGEAFFKYLVEENVDAVFAIKKDSQDYQRISKIGSVVEYESLAYKFFMCICECHISSQLDHMENHDEAPQIFLQHGVTGNDISKYINPASHKNFYLIVTTLREKEAFCGPNYIIDSKNVLLTGFPRFDYLRNNPQKIITIAFTWRSKFMFLHEEEIVNSDYFRTIIKIMTDKELNDYINDSGFKLYIKIHPSANSVKKLLPKNVIDREYRGNYNTLFEETSLLITDYSSVVFDFVYLKKPVMYYQFDGDKYYDNPYTDKGYFNYVTDGFGPVVYDYNDFSSCIKEIIRKNCEMEEKYKERVDSFFTFHDSDNCKRVYDSILQILDKKHVGPNK